MTTTINTIDDFARILRENPDWVDTLRALLLSKELLELPERFAEFVAATNARLTRIEADVVELKEGQARTEADIAELKEGQARTEADIAELKEGQARTEADIAELKEGQARTEADIAELKEGQARTEADIAELKEGQARTEADIAELKEGQARLEDGFEMLKAGQEIIMRGQRRIQDDIGFIRGRFTSIATQEEIRGIVNELGFIHRHTLTKDEIMDVSLSQDTSDIPRSDLRSFRRADFIVEVADTDGAVNYITIEASYTLTDYDRQRAVRNAGLMTRFTGRSSYPALTGVRIDNELTDAIANGEILWYAIDEANLTPE